MPRKQNGFGSSKSFSVKGYGTGDRVDKSMRVKAAGVYPSNRQFGTLVQRTIIESYDAESDWIRWRKGYEYYTKAAMEDLIVAIPVKGSPEGDVAEAQGKPVYDPGLPLQENPEKPNFNPQYLPFVQTAQLYSDTEFALNIEFTGRRFSTKNSDTSNHYCIKRTVGQNINPYNGDARDLNLYNIEKVLYPDDPDKQLAAYAKEAIAYNEIWVKGTPGIDFPILGRTLGDRLTDGEVKDSNGVPVEVNGTATEATYIGALNAAAQPAIYVGKSTPEAPTQVTVRVVYTDLVGTEFFEANNQDLNAYVGQIGYLPQFYNIEEFSAGNSTELTFRDDAYFFEVELNDQLASAQGNTRQGFFILERDTSLPPSLYDIAELPYIFVDKSGYEAEIKGTYVYQKSDYQRFFGDQYLTAELVESSITGTSYPTLPFIIQSVARTDAGPLTGYYAEFTAVPFISTLDLYDIPPADEPGYLIFADYSFTQTKLDTDARGNYLHPIQGPYDTVVQQAAGEEKFAKQVWYKKINDIKPYDKPFVNIFTIGQGIRPATVYACSCPSYSKTQLRMPQSSQGADQRKINRQQNYPLPTAQSRDDYSSIGVNTAAGKMQSWQTNQQRNSFNVCKHSIASMFKDHLKLQEPNTYQTQAARDEFGAKLAEDMKSQLELFQEAYARGGISLLEVVFAMGESLNYDEMDLAYIVLNSDEQAKAHADYFNQNTINSRLFGRIL